MAAGLGFKTFTSGEVLTAADTNGYLMQGINVFANASARSAAVTSPEEGQYSYLKDTNALEYYDGAAWVGQPIGDITALTAGTGISITNATGPIPTVAIDAAATPQLSSANSFTTNQIITGSSTNPMLRITQTGSGNAITIEDSANPDSTPTIIDQNGKIVIGTTTAATTYLGGAAIVPPMQVIGNTNATTATLNARYTADANGPYFNLAKSRSTTLGDATGAVVLGDVLGGITMAGSDGTNMVEGARIQAFAAATPGTAQMYGSLSFQTSNGSTLPVQRLLIDQNSRVVVTGSFGRGGALQKTADFTLAVTENWIVNMKTGSGLVITLPSASTFGGREVMITNWQAQTVTASASVVVKNNGGTSTAILPATVGTWATLVSDGTNWIMTQYKDT